MTTTQQTRTVDRQPATDPTRRAATIVGWMFVVTYVTSISAKIWAVSSRMCDVSWSMSWVSVLISFAR